MKTRRYLPGLLILAGLIAIANLPAASQDIQVDSASPSAAPQGTVNLDVTITGNGFKKGAQTRWFVTGTTNPGGVTVNSTTFKGATQLVANITVVQDAIIGRFDILVTNTNGRTGKGTDKFAVTPKGTPVGCWTSGTPAGFTLVAQLNKVQPNGAALITTLRLGNGVRVRPVDLNGDTVSDSLLAVITSGRDVGKGTWAFLLDPSTGLPQTSHPVTGAPWQNPLLLLSGVAANLAVGDVNGDRIPDFVLFDSFNNLVYLLVGALNPAGSTAALNYAAQQIPPPSGAPSYFGQSVALGDLDGDGADEVAVGATSPDARDKAIPAVFIYKYIPGSGTAPGSLSFVRKIQDPTGSANSQFGSAVAIGSVDANSGNDLVVGAKSASTASGGAVYVLNTPLAGSSYLALAGPGPNFGEGLGIADVNLDGTPDLMVITGDQFSGSTMTAQAFLYAGPIAPGASFTNQLRPNGPTNGWGAPNSDVGDLLISGAVVVGAPNANNDSSGSCNVSVGAVHLFTGPFSSTQSTNYLLEPPNLQGSGFGFGYGVGIAPGYPFIFVGEHYRDVGTTTTAGQVYVYKKN